MKNIIWKIKCFNNKVSLFVEQHRKVVFLIVFLIAIIGISVFEKYKINKTIKNDGGIELPSYDEYILTLKDEPSDIEGMTMYEKAEKGLDYRDGSDSDGDGLTDKEEIEIYGTNPLKASTSGDLYTDAYKIANNMDTQVKHEYSGDLEFSYNECKEVSLDAASATDFFAVVEDYTGRYSLSDYGIDEVYKTYFLYNFSGSFSIDLSGVFRKNDIDESDIDVFILNSAFLEDNTAELKSCDYEIKEDVITLDYEFSSDGYYYVFVTSRKNLIIGALNSLFGRRSSQVTGSKNDYCLWVSKFFFTDQVCYYPKQEDEKKEQIIIDNLRKTDSKTPLIPLTEKEIAKKYKLYKSVLPFFEADVNIGANKLSEVISLILRYGLFSYSYFDYRDMTSININAATNGGGDDEEVKIKFFNYHTSFDPNVDELPFKNFTTLFRSGGNCAGISYLTAYLANQGTFPGKGKYKVLEWDLTKDNINKTLMDPGLIDYKPETLSKKNFAGHVGKQKYEKLGPAEKEFVKMISAMSNKVNDVIKEKKCYYAVNNEYGLSYSVAEQIMDRLNAGKVVMFGMSLLDGSGHMIVIYDYYFLKDYPDEFIFRVYDSNYPRAEGGDYTLKDKYGCYIHCKKINKNGRDIWLYLYNPLKENSDYTASSDPMVTKTSVTEVIDEFMFD